MAKDIPYYFADTGINGEMLGEQNVYSLPLTNTVLTSNIFNITINNGGFTRVIASSNF